MTVATAKTFDFQKLQPGDLVAGEVIDLLRNSQSPVLDWESLFQAGGAVTDRLLPDGILHRAYSTFRRVSADTWEYRGACIRGQSTEIGVIPTYCNNY